MRVALILLLKVHKSLNGLMELSVELSLLLLSVVMVLRSLSHVVLNLRFDLSEVGLNISVSLSDLALGELSDLSRFHALLVLEEALGSTEEAIEGDDLLEESELGAGSGLLMGSNGLLQGLLDLVVDLGGVSLSGLVEGLTDNLGNFLDLRLSFNLNSLGLLDGKEEGKRDDTLERFVIHFIIIIKL